MKLFSFAERMAALTHADKSRGQARRRLRPSTAAVSAVASLAVAASVLIWVASIWTSKGEMIAKDRVQVQIDSRAAAVLEPGARISWRSEEVRQADGDVFYRVEPGASFRVLTPAGDVTVTGTCFRVSVRQPEDMRMTQRDVAAGTIGTAAGAFVLVGVYEGHVRVSHGAQQVQVTPGNAAVISPGGLRLVENTATERDAFEAASASDTVYAQANENLAETIASLNRRLLSVQDQKMGLERQLREAEQRLEMERADGAAPRADSYNPSPNEWADLAKEGTVRFQIPCLREQGWSPSNETVQEIGLGPTDIPVIRDAYSRSNRRLWDIIRPLCGQALGSIEGAEKLGADTCVHLISNVERAKDPEGSRAILSQVGEIRAGIRAAPDPRVPINPALRVFLALTGEINEFEADLAKSLGPDDAHRIASSPSMCFSSSQWGGRSRPPK